MTARLVATSVLSPNRGQHRRFLGILVGSRFTFTDRYTDKNTNSQDFWEFWRMRRQCVPGSLSPPPESEPGFEAIHRYDQTFPIFVLNYAGAWRVAG